MFKDGGATLEKTDVASLEKMFNKTPEAEVEYGGGGGGNGGNIGGGRGDGGGGGGGGSGGSFEYNKSTLSADEKFGIKGMFAKECLLYNLPQDYINGLKNNPLKEMTDIQKVRGILDSQKFKELFPAAFDLKTKKIHFFVHFEDAKKVCWSFEQTGIQLSEI